MILNRAKDYCENDKERLREQARDKYRNLPEERKNKKKKEYEKNRYCDMSEEKKKRLKEYKKKNTARQVSVNIIIVIIIIIIIIIIINKIVFNCNFDSYTNKIVFFNYYLIKCAIYLAVYY